jgi:hypothetical protein
MNVEPWVMNFQQYWRFSYEDQPDMCTLSASRHDDPNRVLVCWPSSGAQPSQPVIVTNGTANPVQVQGTINIALNPYQHEAVIGDSTTCPDQQCIFKFAPVPQGQRLVITHVSAQVGPAQAFCWKMAEQPFLSPRQIAAAPFWVVPSRII